MSLQRDYNNQLFEILNNKLFSSKFIAGIAGDRLQTDEEKILFESLIQESGDDFYVKILFYITHKIFEKEHALKIWQEIIEHKKNLAVQLHRNVEITVAALDYLTNITNEIQNPKIIGEAFLGKIAEISSVDTLTKLFNRQHLMQFLNVELNRYKRYSIPFSILLIDIDEFKLINDIYGHQKGDEALIEISKLLMFDLRELDICTRYGGEEFIIVLPHTIETEAYEMAERIREKIENYFSNSKKITISIGISTVKETTLGISELIKLADNALYLSKKNGRNKTTLDKAM